MAISWNSVPDYDEWGIDNSWKCVDWVNWHKELVKHYGKDRAKLIWEYAFAQGTEFASHWDCRTFNTDLRKYASQNNLSTYDSAGFISPVLATIGAGKDLFTGVANAMSMKKTKTILGILLIGGAGLFIYNRVKK
jgi:hypothetical protein